VDKKDKPAGAGFFGTKELLKKYKKDTPGESVKEVYKDSGLGKWFGQSAGGEAGWDRYNTKGERVGKCGDSKPGEGKPKCLSPEKARKLRTQGGKKAIGNAAKRKKSQDPNTDRPGTGNKPINVSNNIKKEDRDMKSAKEFLNDMINEQINEDLLNEKNKPTNPALWAKSISAAKSKFDVYPSAYANAWASKHYKAAGGGWESTNEETELDEALKVKKNDGPFTVVAIKGGKVVDTFRGAEHGELKDVVAFSKANNKGAKISVEAKGGKVVHTEGFEIDDELIDLDLSEAKKKRITKLHGKFPKGTHYCATHVEHAEFGHGNPIHSQHAAPDEFGDIEWYDVMFEHGIEQGVATDDLQIHLGEVHENHDHTEGEDLEEGEFDSRKSAEEIRLRTKYRMSKDGGKDGKPYSPEDMHGAMDSLQRKKARTSGVKRKGSKHPDNNPVNLKIGEAMGPGIAHKDGLKDAQKTDSMQRYYDKVKQDQAARAKKIEQERKDGIRSKYESVEQVDEISSDTLRSYVGKARQNTDHNKRKKRTDGVSGALSRLDARSRLKRKADTSPEERAISKRLASEDVEQVDELKKSTLMSYKDKAKKSERSGRDTGFEGETSSEREAGVRQVKKRVKGIDGATKRLVARQYEDVEQIDELSPKTLKSYIWKAKGKVQSDLNTGKHSPETNKRAKNVVKAKRRVGEDVERIDELNRDTLGSYADKARGDIEGIKNVLKAKKLGPVSDKHREELERELANRTKGRKKAIGKKYTREDVEQVDEISSDTLRSYVAKRRKQTVKDLSREDGGHNDSKLKKNNRGVSNALSRLDARDPKGFYYGNKAFAREDVEQVDELKMPEKTKAKRDAKNKKERKDGNRSRYALSASSPLRKPSKYESVEQVDELKMPEKDKRGRAKDPVIGAALERGSRRADLKAHGKLRRGDTDGAEGHMTRSRKRQAASRTPVEEAKVGDTVHLGHASKGGSGVKGKVVKIDGINVHIKNDKGAMFKGPMDRVTVGEAIKYDAAHPDQGITGRVTGKGKRDRGPKGSKTSGEVRTKYSGHPAYKKDSPGLPIKANDIGRLIKTARKKSTKPYDSRNLRNPRLTRDHVEHGVDEGIENMTPAQERDRQHRDNPTRKTVAGVRLPSTDKERASYVKKFQADKAGKPGNTKPRKMRDLQMRLRGPK